MKTISALQPRDTTRLLRIARVLNTLASDIETTLGEVPAKRRRKRAKKAKVAKPATEKATKKSKKYPANAVPAEAAATS